MHYLDLGIESKNENYKEIQYKIESLISQFTSQVPKTVDKSVKTLTEIYSAINLYTNYEFSDFNENEVFYFKYFPKVPTHSDERYNIIKKYACKFNLSNKTDYFCTEQNNCLTFELFARNPKNIKAIEEIVSIYETKKKDIELFFDLIFEKETALKKHGVHKLKKETRDEIHRVCSTLNEKLKLLKLVPYKYYHENEMFQHWAINPKIYAVMNLIFQSFSLPIINTTDVISKVENSVWQFKKTRTYFYKINKSPLLGPEQYYFQSPNTYIKTIHYVDTHYLEHIKKLTLFSELVQSIQIAEPFDLSFASFEDYLAELIQNNVHIQRTIKPLYYYPHLDEAKIVNITVDSTSGITNAMQLFEKIYSSFISIEPKEQEIQLNATQSIKSKEQENILNIFYQNHDTGSIAEDLFYYDYFKYRQEQQAHILKYLNELLKLHKKEFSKIFKKLSKAAIYEEMSQLKTVDISSDAIRKKIDKIEKYIN